MYIIGNHIDLEEFAKNNALRESKEAYEDYESENEYIIIHKETRRVFFKGNDENINLWKRLGIIKDEEKQLFRGIEEGKSNSYK